MSELNRNGIFLVEDVSWKLTVVFVFLFWVWVCFFLAVNWHTPSVHMLLILPVWSDQSIFPQDFPVCCSLPHPWDFCSWRCSVRAACSFPNLQQNFCWPVNKCELCPPQCRRSGSRGWSWGNPRDSLVVAASGNLVQYSWGFCLWPCLAEPVVRDGLAGTLGNSILHCSASEKRVKKRLYWCAWKIWSGWCLFSLLCFFCATHGCRVQQWLSINFLLIDWKLN